MSYSFQVRGATKAEAVSKVAAELDNVVASQPIHAKDKAQASAAAESFVALLQDDPAKDIQVYMSGSVSYSAGEDQSLYGASVNVQASLVSKV